MWADICYHSSSAYRQLNHLWPKEMWARYCCSIISLWADTKHVRHLERSYLSSFVVLVTMLFDGHSVNSSVTCYTFCRFVTILFRNL